jgi:hypothetical protein
LTTCGGSAKVYFEQQGIIGYCLVQPNLHSPLQQ